MEELDVTDGGIQNGEVGISVILFYNMCKDEGCRSQQILWYVIIWHLCVIFPLTRSYKKKHYQAN